MRVQIKDNKLQDKMEKGSFVFELGTFVLRKSLFCLAGAVFDDLGCCVVSGPDGGTLSQPFRLTTSWWGA
jgi:hypothetical protein